MDNANLYQKVRQHEPVMRYRTGELFFPMKVDDYVAQCCLHKWDGEDKHSLILPRGELSVHNLSDYGDVVNFMVYADQNTYAPPADVEAKAQLADKVIEIFRKLSSDVTHGKLPKRVIETAHAEYGGLAKNPPTYYYRVLRKENSPRQYDVIQYWFYYAFNDWATTFGGVNDHEADWEMIQLLFDDITDEHPRYGVYAAHGKPFSRKWDELEKDSTGQHPIVYLQGGSHGAFPSRYVGDFGHLIRRIVQNPLKIGEYITEYVDAGGKVWDEGDISIGAGGTHAWEDTVNLPEQPWVNGYRGLWGARYFVKKSLFSNRKVPRTGGAPADPMFTIDGKIRPIWETPIKWSKL